mgnify:CR=1 FL=1
MSASSRPLFTPHANPNTKNPEPLASPISGSAGSKRLGCQSPLGCCAFAIDRAILPTQVTRFHLVGSVSGGREEGIPNATGTLDIDVDLPDNLGTFHGSGPITTDGSAVYSVEVDVVSNYAFPLYEDAITATIDIDGFVGEGFLQDMTVESGDPRVVSGFGSF